MWIYRAAFVHVVDGDTLDLDIDLGFGVIVHKQRVRLLGVNTPELRGGTEESKAAGRAAREFVYRWVSDPVGEWPLTVTTSKGDSFGRWLADVWRRGDDASLSDHLLNAGHAVPYRQ